MPAQFSISPAQPAECLLLEHLHQLYLYDISVCVKADLDPTGRYPAPALQVYWTAAHHAAFLLRLDSTPIGFALVSGHSKSPEPFSGYCCDALFVLRRHRRQHLGQLAAHAIFARLPGAWEVAAPSNNPPAQSFFRAVVDRFTHGRYRERWLETNDFRGSVQSFAVSPAGITPGVLATKGLCSS